MRPCRERAEWLTKHPAIRNPWSIRRLRMSSVLTVNVHSLYVSRLWQVVGCGFQGRSSSRRLGHSLLDVLEVGEGLTSLWPWRTVAQRAAPDLIRRTGGSYWSSTMGGIAGSTVTLFVPSSRWPPWRRARQCAAALQPRSENRSLGVRTGVAGANSQPAGGAAAARTSRVCRGLSHQQAPPTQFAKGVDGLDGRAGDDLNSDCSIWRTGYGQARPLWRSGAPGQGPGGWSHMPGSHSGAGRCG